MIRNRGREKAKKERSSNKVDMRYQVHGLLVSTLDNLKFWITSTKGTSRSNIDEDNKKKSHKVRNGAAGIIRKTRKREKGKQGG
jgi:hypothetical protein